MYFLVERLQTVGRLEEALGEVRELTARRRAYSSSDYGAASSQQAYFPSLIVRYIVLRPDALLYAHLVDEALPINRHEHTHDVALRNMRDRRAGVGTEAVLAGDEEPDLGGFDGGA